MGAAKFTVFLFTPFFRLLRIAARQDIRDPAYLSGTNRKEMP